MKLQINWIRLVRPTPRANLLMQAKRQTAVDVRRLLSEPKLRSIFPSEIMICCVDYRSAWPWRKALVIVEEASTKSDRTGRCKMSAYTTSVS